MIRGTTPTHTFTLPFGVEAIQTAKVIYNQFGRVVLTKTGDELELSGSEIKTRLAQEDTLAFDRAGDVLIQLRVLTAGGDALASEIMKVPVGRLLEDGVLV